MATRLIAWRLASLSFFVALAMVVGATLGVGISLASPAAPAAARPRYEVVSWNDLGMHCYNGSFADIVVLPPFNTLWAQVIQVGSRTRVVTSGVKVSYTFPGNSYSAGKTDFWVYATKAFGLSRRLPPNVGLKGKRLSGDFDVAGDHFVAAGIPLTEFADADVHKRQPFQKALITVRDAKSGAVLTTATVVAPVSSEMGCAMCHADDGDATTRYPITPTGDFQKNILALHDYLNLAKYPAGHRARLLTRRPVLCSECHADAALGAKGVAGVSSLSNAMHRHHNPTNCPDIAPNNDGCYCCHPGPDTKCLRCVMSQRYGIGCVDCHGTIAQVAKNPAPWVKEPSCASVRCHGAAYRTDQPLYRNSKGHGGMYCAACHDSPHAIATSREANDAIKFVELQGSRGTLRKCSVCHSTTPRGRFIHGWTAPKPRVTLTRPKSLPSIYAGRALLVSGTIAPKQPTSARSVLIRVFRASGSRWVAAGTYWARNIDQAASTRYVCWLQLPKGNYRLYARAPEDKTHASTDASGWQTVVVR